MLSAFLALSHVNEARAQAVGPSDIPVFIVDKAKYQIHVANYKNGLEIFKTYPITVGKNSGDKMLEGDLKTPEGIYRFTTKFVPPQIKRKFGAMAFYVDYPNSIDRRDKKTGFDIMLHSTDDPARLERPQDSDGCIVVDDDRIRDLANYIHTPYTTLLIYDELKPEHLQSETSGDLKVAFEKWLAAWTAKDIDGYIDSYAEGFRFEQMNRDQYKAYKDGLNKRYETIDVKATNTRFFRHPKYDMVTFTQEYSSTFKGGRRAFVARGQKRIYFVRENGALKIFSEEFSRR
ncbi:MAG: L,D-transpeptidase family protein, partial [Bdellovibrionales bacterium]|jgi:murein L,D-transpeptidase YafK|nr:L,D-transpeptidase family protein [Bdellovibrionales bacterium]